MTLISLFSLNFYKSFHDYTLLLRAPLDGYRRSKNSSQVGRLGKVQRLLPGGKKSLFAFFTATELTER